MKPIRLVIATLAGSLAMSSGHADAGPESSADVIIYGATPGGFCATIAAAREGASVILVESTEHVGGLNTGGLSFSDSNQTVRNTVMGLFDEWHIRIEKDYTARGITLPYSVRVKDQAKRTYEPDVAARVKNRMLDEAGVKVLTRHRLKTVKKEESRITRLITSNGEFAAKVFIDATYEGDLLAAAGVSWTIGREGREKFGESPAGKRYPKPRVNISGLDAVGKPLPLITTTDAGPEEAGRNAIWEAHKQYTLEFYHFLTTDPAVPKSVRTEYSRLGVCKDEFPEIGHFPPQLCVFEGRRIRGMYVINQNDILVSQEKEDPIAISSFPIDSHDCQRVALKNGGVINEGTIMPVRMTGTGHGYPYHVPYRAILPKPDECSSLLVPVALSCTHVGISSIRVEPTWMIIGQSAGVAAALAAREQVAVQDLSYPKLRARLVAQKQVLELSAVADATKPGSATPPKRNGQ